VIISNRIIIFSIFDLSDQRASGKKINEFIVKACKDKTVSIEELRAGSVRREVSKVRAQIAIGLVESYGVSFSRGCQTTKRYDLSGIENHLTGE
jgi:hypothetical protein